MAVIKKVTYIALFTLLGILLQFIVHGVLEWAYILLLRSNYALFSFGLSFETLLGLHHAFTVGLMGTGIVFGFMMGKYWWGILYDEKGELRKDIVSRWSKQIVKTK